MPTDDRRLQELLDKQAITEQLATYCRAADRIDLDLLRSVFHADAAADYGAMYSGSGHGFADFIGRVHPSMQAHSHHLGNILIRVDGDHAASESYVLVRTRTRDGDTLTDIVAHGRYLDRWERRDGVWRIAGRRYLHTLDETRAVKLPLFDTAGSRDRDDPSYALIGDRA